MVIRSDKFMEVLFPKEELELSMLVTNECEKDMIKLTIINYPVTWDTIREMIMCGWSVNRISAFCKEMYFKGKIIVDVWNVVKGIASLRIK
jgi:hypothetical protein